MSARREAPGNFDGVARAYRWLEYMTFARALERCRFAFIPALADRRKALIFGDGDGRFTSRLTAAAPELSADCVDASERMLELLRVRAPRARTHLADARDFSPPGAGYDLVATHFFLDCLTTEEVAALAERLNPSLSEQAVWVVSEFSIASGFWAMPSAALVRALYLAFRILTGLRTTRLPDHGAALRAAGWRLSDERRLLGGMLRAEFWRRAA